MYSSALSGAASNPALPTRLLLRLLAHDENGGDGPPRRAVHRAGLPEDDMAAGVGA
ncbi:hypothetical protein [Streptomyces sp. NPDC056527]|uniref:hypothetical protein n=1 Tax=Streptomyces sp. NPDC056527 TaxID=3345853 RepID=UPI0036994B53